MNKVKAIAQCGVFFALDTGDKFVIVNTDKQGADTLVAAVPKAEKPSFVDDLVKNNHYRYLQPPIDIKLPEPVAKEALSSTNGGGALVPSNISNIKGKKDDKRTI